MEHQKSANIDWLEESADIIIEALCDYRRWFIEDESEDSVSKEKLNQIDLAIHAINRV